MPLILTRDLRLRSAHLASRADSSGMGAQGAQRVPGHAAPDLHVCGLRPKRTPLEALPRHEAPGHGNARRYRVHALVTKCRSAQYVSSLLLHAPACSLDLGIGTRLNLLEECEGAGARAGFRVARVQGFLHVQGRARARARVRVRRAQLLPLVSLL